jgi:hypothetical protein
MRRPMPGIQGKGASIGFQRLLTVVKILVLEANVVETDRRRQTADRRHGERLYRIHLTVVGVIQNHLTRIVYNSQGDGMAGKLSGVYGRRVEPGFLRGDCRLSL